VFSFRAQRWVNEGLRGISFISATWRICAANAWWRRRHGINSRRLQGESVNKTDVAAAKQAAGSGGKEMVTNDGERW